MYFIVNTLGKHVLKHYNEFVYLIQGIQLRRYVGEYFDQNVEVFSGPVGVWVPHLWYQTSCFFKILPHFDCTQFTQNTVR